MSLFPKIQSPCPYRGPLSDIMDGDICRLCKRAVVDLTEMDDDGRRTFIENCDGEVCVSYKVVLRPAIAAAMAGMVFAASPAAATGLEIVVVTAGGIKAPKTAEWVEQTAASDLPELPVVYDDAAEQGGREQPEAPVTELAGT